MKLDQSQPFHETEWTEEKNRRRCDLVDKEIDGRCLLTSTVSWRTSRLKCSPIVARWPRFL